MGNTCRTCGKIRHLAKPCFECGRKPTPPPACGNTPNVINLKETEYVAWRYVVLPESYGTEEEYPLPNLKDAYLIYGANGHSYFYDSGGIHNRMPDFDTPSIIAALTARVSATEQGLDDETSARQAADEEIIADLATEIGNRESGDNALQDAIDDEAAAREAADDTLQGNIDNITDLIPAQASSDNQLADKAFVNSTVQTDTANFRGSWSDWASVPTDPTLYPADFAGVTTPTVNDYMVIQDASDYVGTTTLDGTWRFKYTGNWDTDGKSGWEPEYQVNETPFTAVQLAAVNSGITAAAVAKLTGLADIQTVGTGLNLASGTLTTTTMTGATNATNGVSGMVPAPSAGDQNKFLKGDGTWGVVDDGSNLSNQTSFWGQTVVNGVVNGEMTGPTTDTFKFNSGSDSFGFSFRVGTTPVERFNINATQMNAYQPINMHNSKVTGLADGTVATDAATYGQLTAELTTKQDTLTFDATPTQNSTNPVTSGGVYNMIGDVESLLSAI